MTLDSKARKARQARMDSPARRDPALTMDQPVGWETRAWQALSANLACLVRLEIQGSWAKEVPQDISAPREQEERLESVVLQDLREPTGAWDHAVKQDRMDLQALEAPQESWAPLASTDSRERLVLTERRDHLAARAYWATAE